MVRFDSVRQNQLFGYTVTLTTGVAAMSPKSSVGSNIKNRSPWLVQVRSKPHLDQQFAFGNRQQAESYLSSLANQGHKAKLLQLESSFQLRLRHTDTTASETAGPTEASAPLSPGRCIYHQWFWCSLTWQIPPFPL